jgi:hypothetical protein
MRRSLGKALLVCLLGSPAGAAVEPSGSSAATTAHVQLVDDFSWPLDSGSYRYYSRLAAARGTMGAGAHHHATTVEAGQLRLVAAQGDLGTSWTGLWASLSGDADDPTLALDFQRALPWPIRDAFQARITSIRLRARGVGRLKIELKRPDDTVLRVWTQAVDSPGWTSLELPTTDVAEAVKLLNVVAESPSDLWVDDVSFAIEMPALTPLRYAFVVSLAQLLRAYDPETGWVRDHAQWPSGAFTSVPASGEVALAVAAASQLGVVSPEDARTVAAKASGILLHAPRLHGWLPHFLENDRPHPRSEWSTLDTAIGLLAAIQAATALGQGDDRDQLRAVVDGLDFASVTLGDGRLSMGFDSSQSILPNAWDRWGSELSLVDILRAYRDPLLPPLPTEPLPGRQPPAYCGRGFIYPMAGLLVPGNASPRSDRWGVVWSQALRDHLAAQRASVGGGWLFGLSSAEILTDGGDTPYWEGGIGDPVTPCPANPGPGDGHWVAPHYIGMSAASWEPPVSQMEQAGLLPPLSGPAESAHVDASGTIVRIHTAQVSLNAFFNTLGYYHALVKAESLPDVVYRAVEQDERYRAAVAAFFPTTAGPLQFHTLVPPCRVVDTRDASRFGPKPLSGGAEAAFSVGGQCGIPETAWALAGNVTVTQPAGLGHLRLFPADTSPPLTSSLNFGPGQTRANNVVVPLNDLGRLGVLVSQGAGSVHVIIDTSGYFQ